MDRIKIICTILIWISLNGYSQKNYDDTKRVNDKPTAFISMHLGSIIPDRANSVLGFHPVMGVSLGARKAKFSYSVTGEGRIADTRQGYMINNKDQDTLMLTNEFLGALIGAEAGYTFFQKDSWSIDALAGVGYELVRTILYPENYTDDVTINTYNLNIGLSCRKKINATTYLGLTARYNFVDYTLANQSDLIENYFLLTLHLGYNARRTPKTGVE